MRPVPHKVFPVVYLAPFLFRYLSLSTFTYTRAVSFSHFIEGKSVSSGKGTIRAFRRDIEHDIANRNNELYDKHIGVLAQVIVTYFQIRKMYFFK